MERTSEAETADKSAKCRFRVSASVSNWLFIGLLSAAKTRMTPAVLGTKIACAIVSDQKKLTEVLYALILRFLKLPFEGLGWGPTLACKSSSPRQNFRQHGQIETL